MKNRKVNTKRLLNVVQVFVLVIGGTIMIFGLNNLRNPYVGQSNKTIEEECAAKYVLIEQYEPCVQDNIDMRNDAQNRAALYFALGFGVIVIFFGGWLLIDYVYPKVERK